ncbi:MAG: DinB family protein [Deltaproteobacteria bacterium]|nr:DinB family protein [Deltaproteobacteria bacterium]
MTTISELRDKFEMYDRTRRAFLDDLAGLNDGQLRVKPSPSEWSILQIVQHMVLAERDVMQYLPEPKELIVRKRGLRARIFYVVVLFILRWGIRVPVPSEGMVPDGSTSLSELRQQWDENLRWFRGYLDSLRLEDLQHAVFSHPVAGPLTGPQAGTLAQYHFDAHLRQINKAKALVMAGSSG